MEDLPHSGRQRITTPGQDGYIMNTHLRFETASAIAAYNPGTHNDLKSTQTVGNHLHKSGLHELCPDICCVLIQRHCVNQVHTIAG